MPPFVFQFYGSEGFNFKLSVWLWNLVSILENENNSIVNCKGFHSRIELIFLLMAIICVYWFFILFVRDEF